MYGRCISVPLLKMVKKKVMAVRSRVARMKHQQWRIKSNMDKDINRAEAITGESKADDKQ